MKDKIFYDTNIWIYRYLISADGLSENKRDKTKKLLLDHTKIVISNQVINELSCVLYKKYNFSIDIIKDYIWEIINISEVYTIKAKTNYLFPFFTILFAVLALLAFKRFSETKIEVTKSVSHVKTKNGEFALKIILSLKAKKDVENVTLIDKVPAIVKIYKNFGIVKPDKIDTESRRISWHIGDLNAGEERILTYIVYSKVGVIGKFSLPEALIVFEKNDQIHEVESNKVFFMSDQIKGN